MWNKNQSIALSVFCVRLFAVIMVGIWFTAPWIFGELVAFRGDYLAGKLPFFLASTYVASVPAVFALWQLHGLLRDISLGRVFVRQNVSRLRGLSWACIWAGVICLVSGFYYLPFLLIAVAAAFVGLILRVVKNVFEQAVTLKDENDYTI